MKRHLTRLLLAAVCCLQGAAAFPARALTDTLTLAEVSMDMEKRVKEYHALTFHVRMAVPDRAQALSRHVEAWAEQLFASGLDIAPAGPYASADEMAAHYGQEFADRSQKEIARIARQRRKEAGKFHLTYTFDLTVRRVYETARFITFSAEAFCFRNDGEGTQERRYATFRKSDGHILTWDDLILPKKKPQMRGVVADALQGFFGLPNFASLRSQLGLPATTGRAGLPLPAGSPGLLADGLYAQYATGELGGSSARLPLAIVPYAKMKQLWSAEARRLWR